LSVLEKFTQIGRKVGLSTKAIIKVKYETTIWLLLQDTGNSWSDILLLLLEGEIVRR
jgi:hypothetical protein